MIGANIWLCEGSISWTLAVVIGNASFLTAVAYLDDPINVFSGIEVVSIEFYIIIILTVDLKPGART